MEKSVILEKDLQNLSNVCAAIDVLSNLLSGYLTVARPLLDLGYQQSANFTGYLQTRTFVPEIS